MRQITHNDLDALTQQAGQSPRLRANLNLHQELTDPTQRLAIAMEPGTLIPPHRHHHTFEVLLALRGRFVVLTFDDAGTVLERTLLGENAAVVEIPAGCWHTMLPLEAGCAFFEIKQGAYVPVSDADIAHWSKGRSAEQLNAWYSVAQVGERMT